MTATVPAGWYSDPAQRHQFRYWDGRQWTEHVSTGGATSVDPVGPAPADGAQAAAGQAGAQPASGGTAAGLETAGTIAAGASAGASPTGGSPAGFAFPGEAAAGTTPEGTAPASGQAAASASPGSAWAGSASPGSASPSSAWAGSASPGSASPGSAWAGSASPGEAQGGFVPPGSAVGMGAAPGGPVMSDSPGMPGTPTVVGAPARGRSRRRWLLAGIAAVVLLGLLTGLLIWAPWVPPPVLRPGGLTAGSATTSSVSLHWSGPATGPLPDKYLILHDGSVIGSVRGSVTTYQISGLVPASDYAYQVAAERGGKRSRPSARLLLTTVTPPVSAARLDGAWTVNLKIRQGASSLTGQPPKVWTEGWTTSPKCSSGPCNVTVTGTLNGHSFKATLKRSGAQYRGKTTANVIPCGSGSAAIPSRSTMTFKIKVTDAGVTGRAWTASSWTGSLVVNSPYVSSSSYYCTASTLVFGMSAAP